MQIFFDFLPILLFFITYKLFGIYSATAVAIITSLVQVSLQWLYHHSVEKTHIITFILVTVLGGATLFLHNAMFIKWKPTAIYWTLATIFILSHTREKTLIQSLMDNKITLPNHLWNRLNISWSLFFISLGIINLFVIYHFTTNVWVNFKLFGTLGLTLIFVTLQSIYMSRQAINER